MTHRERFHRLMNFQPVDRLPAVEWAGYWDKTLARWHDEGLPREWTDHFEIRRQFGLDPYRQLWPSNLGPDTPAASGHGAGIIADESDYERILPTLYPDPRAPTGPLQPLREWAGQSEREQFVFWLTLEGFFWFPRKLLGIQRHLYAFYDQRRLMHRINTDLLAYNLRLLEAVEEVITPDFMTFAEDMSYNHGPMISRELFEEFMAPYYRQITPRLRQAGVRIFVDSDGDVTDLTDWMLAVGVEGFLPLERMAGVDVAHLRRRWPKLLMVGAFDKTVMHRGEQAIRREFRRLLPVVQQGGFVLGVDHQTPPEVSLEQYRRYLAILREFCRTAAAAIPARKD